MFQKLDENTMHDPAPATLKSITEATGYIHITQALIALPIKELVFYFKALQKEAGQMFSLLISQFSRQIEDNLLSGLCTGLAESHRELWQPLVEKIKELADFEVKAEVLDRIDGLMSVAESLIGKMNQLSQGAVFQDEKNQKGVIAAMEAFPWKHIKADALEKMMDFCIACDVKKIAYLPLLQSLGAVIKKQGFESKHCTQIVVVMNQFLDKSVDPALMNALIDFFEPHQADAWSELATKILALQDNPQNASLLNCFVQNKQVFSIENARLYCELVHVIEDEHKEKAADFFNYLMKNDKMPQFLQELPDHDVVKSKTICAILTFVYAGEKSKNPAPDNYMKVQKNLSTCSQSDLNHLLTRCQVNPMRSGALSDPKKDNETMFDYCDRLEKNPFGPRQEAKEFATSEVERVINGLKNIVGSNHQQRYPYAYRRQLMEAFLFVNACGKDLPVYAGKSAKDLNNRELQDFFKILQDPNQHQHLDPAQRRLLALALIREAMYRTTGKFPYSTQMIAVLDCMFHGGDLISQIETGQGKTMVDAMKGALLMVTEGCVDLSTSSLVDAQRDIDINAQFFGLLGIPLSEKPITASSEFAEYQQKGVNYGTAGDFTLFRDEHEAKQNELDIKEDKGVSWIPGEVDQLFLDEPTIYRYASSEGAKIQKSSEWVYYAVLDFYQKNKNSNALLAEQIKTLRAFLKEMAPVFDQKPGLFDISRFSSKDLIALYLACIKEQKQLKNNTDYMIVNTPPVTIDDKQYEGRTAKILLGNGKLSDSNRFGNYLHQYVHARNNAAFYSISIVDALPQAGAEKNCYLVVNDKKVTYSLVLENGLKLEGVLDLPQLMNKDNITHSPYARNVLTGHIF